MRLTPGEKKSAIPSPTMNLRAAACEEPAGYLEEHESEEEARGENAKSRHIGFQLEGHGAKIDAMLYQLTAYTTLATISDQNAPRWATFRSKCCGKSLLAFLIVVPITLRSMRSVNS